MFPGIILRKSLYTEEGTRQNTTIPDQNLCAAPKKACRVAVTHGSIVKTHNIDVIVTHVKPAKRI